MLGAATVLAAGPISINFMGFAPDPFKVENVGVSLLMLGIGIITFSMLWWEWGLPQGPPENR